MFIKNEIQQSCLALILPSIFTIKKVKTYLGVKC